MVEPTPGPDAPVFASPHLRRRVGVDGVDVPFSGGELVGAPVSVERADTYRVAPYAVDDTDFALFDLDGLTVSSKGTSSVGLVKDVRLYRVTVVAGWNGDTAQAGGVVHVDATASTDGDGRCDG